MARERSVAGVGGAFVRALSRTAICGPVELLLVTPADDAPPREASPLAARPRVSRPLGWDLAPAGLYERGPVGEVETPGRARLEVDGRHAVVALAVDVRAIGRGARWLYALAALAGVEREELDTRGRVERWTLRAPIGAAEPCAAGGVVGLFRAERGGGGPLGVPWPYTHGASPSWGVVVDGEPLVRVDGAPPSWPPLRAEGAARNGLGATV